MSRKTKVANVLFRIIIFLGCLTSLVGLVQIVIIGIKENSNTSNAIIYLDMAMNLYIWMIALMILTGVSLIAFIFNFISHKAVNTVSYVFRSLFLFLEALATIIASMAAYVFYIVASVLLGYMTYDRVYDIKDYIDNVDMVEGLCLGLVVVTVVSFVLYLIMSITSIASLNKMGKPKNAKKVNYTTNVIDSINITNDMNSNN